ncbi:UbiD family decarboxylase [uncultured Eubacteriales bacterium]|uniref:UbiD family decarboxylase n=1 Tax=uncultured Eubacteriales bacterium TaxID=172733 RepID=A0A212JLL7_9FIRM|nr:UbiD family decarboxylase [uncultured Eubacteriales bacterium]
MKLTTNSQRILHELFMQEYQDNSAYTDEGAFFEKFGAEQVMKVFDLSDEEVESGVLGAGNDGGCDSIYVLLDGVLMTEDIVNDISTSKDATIDFIIIQAKRENSFGEDAIMKWKTTTENLMEIGVDDTEFIGRYNEDLRSAFSLFRNLYVKLLRRTPKLNIRFFYTTFATEVHPNVQSQADELRTKTLELFPSPKTSVSIDFWGADRILSAAQAQPEQKIQISLTEPPINIGNHHDYVTLVNLGKYYRFITDEHGDLRKYIFEANVRDYQGHNAVNQDIQASLEAPTVEDFWWLNNGITILTNEAIPVTTKELILTEPEIVNGLQTSNEIFNYFHSYPNNINLETRNILVRIIVPESEESRDRIILATNNQTNIPRSSLRANDPIHRQIELFFKGRGLYYDRRKNYYKNQGKKSSDIVSVSFLAQCLISLILQKPNYARARPSTVIAQDETYERLFIENQDLDVFYKSAYLGKKVEHCLKKSNEFTQAQKNDILFYVLLCVVAKKLETTNITPKAIKEINLEYLSDEDILDSAIQVFAEYDALGGDGKVAKGPELIDKIMQIASTTERANIPLVGATV